jgi:hypothetical protein
MAHTTSLGSHKQQEVTHRGLSADSRPEEVGAPTQSTDSQLA